MHKVTKLNKILPNCNRKCIVAAQSSSTYTNQQQEERVLSKFIREVVLARTQV